MRGRLRFDWARSIFSAARKLSGNRLACSRPHRGCTTAAIQRPFMMHACW